MPITTLPASPAGEISHNDARLKINEVISAYNASESTSIVFVRGDDDLPPVVDGFSTLEAQTLYWVMNNTTITRNIRFQNDGSVLYGCGEFSDGVIFAGTGDFITVDNVTAKIENFQVATATATQFINATGTGLNTLRMHNVQFAGPAKLGVINGVSLVCNFLAALSFTDGFSFTGGPFTGLTIQNAFMLDSSASAIHFDFGSATFEDLKMREVTSRGAGTWMHSDLAKHYTPNADGSVTYTGAKPIDTEIFYTESLEKQGGGSAELEVRLAINWTAGDSGLAKSRTVTRNNEVATVSGSSEVTLQPNDNIRLIRANNGTTADIDVHNSKMDFKQ